MTVAVGVVTFLVAAACVGRLLRAALNTRWRWPTLIGAAVMGLFMAGALVAVVTL